MTVWFRQFWLLFCKNLLWKKRQPVSLVLEFIWPISVFLIVVLIKQHPDINPERHTTCYYRARALPSAGFLPFVQSFVCNIDNECLAEEQNEDIPTYKNSQLSQIMDELQPIISSDMFVAFLQDLPETLKILDASSRIANNATFVDQLTHELPLRDLVRNTETLRNLLVEKHQILDERAFIEILSTGSVNITKLIFGVFGHNASNLQHLFCSNTTSAVDDRDPSSLLKIACSLPPEKLQYFVDKLHENLNVEKLIDFLLTATKSPTAVVEPLVVKSNKTVPNFHGIFKQQQIISDVQALLPSVRDVLAKVKKFKRKVAKPDFVENNVEKKFLGEPVKASFKPTQWNKFLSKLYGHLLHADRRFGITAGNLGDNGRVWYGGFLKTMSALADAATTTHGEDYDLSDGPDDVTTSASVLVMSRTKMPQGKSWNKLASRPAVEEELWRRRFVSFVRHHPLSPFYTDAQTKNASNVAAFFDPKNSLSSMLGSSFGREKTRFNGKPPPNFEQLMRMLVTVGNSVSDRQNTIRLRNFLCEHSQQVRSLAGATDAPPTASMMNVQMILSQKCSFPRMKRSTLLLGDKQYADFFASNDVNVSNTRTNDDLFGQVLNSAANVLGKMLPEKYNKSVADTLSHRLAQQVTDAATKNLISETKSLVPNGDELFNRFNVNNQPSMEKVADGGLAKIDLHANLCSGLNLLRDSLSAQLSAQTNRNANYLNFAADSLCPPKTAEKTVQKPLLPQQNFGSDFLSDMAAKTASQLFGSVAGQSTSKSDNGGAFVENLARSGVTALLDFVKNDAQIDGKPLDSTQRKPRSGGLLDGLAGRRNADAIDVAAAWMPSGIELKNYPLASNMLVKAATIMLRGVNDKLEAMDMANTEFLFGFDELQYPQLNTITQVLRTRLPEVSQIILWTYAADSTKVFRLFEFFTQPIVGFQSFCRDPNYFFSQPPEMAKIDALNQVARQLCANIVPELLADELASYFDYNFITQALNLLLISRVETEHAASLSQLMNEIRHFATSFSSILNKIQHRPNINVPLASTSNSHYLSSTKRWKRELSQLAQDFSKYRSTPQATLHRTAQTLHAFSPAETAHAITLLADHAAHWLNEVFVNDFMFFNYSGSSKMQSLTNETFPVITDLLDIVENHWEPLLRVIIYTAVVDNVRLTPLYLSLVDGGLNGSRAAVCQNGMDGIDEAMESLRIPINLLWNNYEFWQRICAIDHLKLADELYVFVGRERIEKLKADWNNIVENKQIDERIDFDTLHRNIQTFVRTFKEKLLLRNQPILSNTWVRNDLWNQLWLDVHQDVMDYFQSVPLSSYLTDIVIDCTAQLFLYWQQRWRSGYNTQSFADVEAALNASESVGSFSTRRISPFGLANVTINELVPPQNYASFNGLIKFVLLDANDFVQIVRETLKTDPDRTARLFSLLLSWPIKDVRARFDKICANPLEFFVEKVDNHSIETIMSDICLPIGGKSILWNLNSDFSKFFWPEQLQSSLRILTNGTTWRKHGDHSRAKRQQQYEPNLLDTSNYVQGVDLFKRSIGNVGFGHELPRLISMLSNFTTNFSLADMDETNLFVINAIVVDLVASKLSNTTLDIHFIAQTLNAVTNMSLEFLNSVSDDKTYGNIARLLTNLTLYEQFMTNIRKAIHTTIQNYTTQTDIRNRLRNESLSLLPGRADQLCNATWIDAQLAGGNSGLVDYDDNFIDSIADAVCKNYSSAGSEMYERVHQIAGTDWLTNLILTNILNGTSDESPNEFNNKNDRQQLLLAVNRAVKLVAPHALRFFRDFMDQPSLLQKIMQVQIINQLTNVVRGGVEDEVQTSMTSDIGRARNLNMFAAATRQAVMEWLDRRIRVVSQSGSLSNFLPKADEMASAILQLLSAQRSTESNHVVDAKDELTVRFLTEIICDGDRTRLHLCDYANSSVLRRIFPSLAKMFGIDDLLEEIQEFYPLIQNPTAVNQSSIAEKSPENDEYVAASSSWWQSFAKIGPKFDWSKFYDLQARFSHSATQLLDGLRGGQVKFDLFQYAGEWVLDQLTSFPNLSYECSNIILPRLDALPNESRLRAHAYLDVGQVAARILRNVLNKVEPLPTSSACWEDHSVNKSEQAPPLIPVETFLYEIIEQLEIERIIVDSLDLYGNAVIAAAVEANLKNPVENSTGTTVKLPLPLFDCFQALQDVVQIARSMEHILLLPQQRQPQSRLSQLFTTCLARVDFPAFASHVADLSGILQSAMSIVHDPAFRRLSGQLGGDPTSVLNAVAFLEKFQHRRNKRQISQRQQNVDETASSPPLTELLDSLNEIFPAVTSDTHYYTRPDDSTSSRHRVDEDAVNSPLLAHFVDNHERLHDELKPIHADLSEALLPIKLNNVKNWIDRLTSSSGLLSRHLCDPLKLANILKLPTSYYNQISSVLCNADSNFSATEIRQVLTALAESVRISSLFATRESTVSAMLAARTNMTIEEVRENARNTFKTSRLFIPAVLRAVQRSHLNLSEIIHGYQNATVRDSDSTNQLLQFVLATTGKFLCGHNFADVLSDLKMVASFGDTFDADKNQHAGEHHDGEEDDSTLSQASQSVSRRLRVESSPMFVSVSTAKNEKSRKLKFNFHAWNTVPVAHLRDTVFEQTQYGKFFNTSSTRATNYVERDVGESSTPSLSHKIEIIGTSKSDETLDRQKKEAEHQQQLEFLEDPFTAAATSFQAVTRNPASFSTATTRRRIGGDIILQVPVRLPGSSFRNEFCTSTFHKLSQMPGGSIMWSYLKPLLRGRIVFYPDTREAWAIMQQANSTFEKLGRAAHFLRVFANSSHLVHTMQWNMVDPLYSRFAEHLVHDLYAFNGGVTEARDSTLRALETSRQELDAVFDELFHAHGKRSGKDIVDRLADLARRVADFIECINLEHRFEAVKTKAGLQKRARELAEDKELIAAVSFLNLYDTTMSSKQPFQLPRHVKYEIQMDIDNVPFTHRIKDYFYVPGPRDNFLDEMRYFRGFVQLQDTIDRAIIQLQKQHNSPLSTDAAILPLPPTYLQQMPYPCYQFDLFNHIVYSTLPMQVILAWIFLVALSIRNMVFERESGLERLMTVHGMRGGVQWLSSCLVTYLTMSMISAIVLGILKLGGVFTISSFGVLFYIFQLFSLSSIAMAYMVAAFFTRSTVAALTGVITYLISYLPFIVIVALEAELHILMKILCCMSSTTAFSFAMFYVNRYEETGVGVQWSNIQQSSKVSLGDDWNVQYACYMMMFDTVLYFGIGFYVRILMHLGGGGGEADGESSSLSLLWRWPLEARRMLLRYWTHRRRRRAVFSSERAYYFNNTAYCKSSSSDGYYDENLRIDDDLSRQDRNKVAGIVCIGLTKIFKSSSLFGFRKRRTDKTAVDDFTMSFYESEITSLLGHNGAGKSTTINMICGFAKPTSGASFIYGYSAGKAVKPNAAAASQHSGVGVCPQQNVLFSFMTVREHLEFYCKLKSGSSFGQAQIIRDVDSILHQLELWDAQAERAVNLSGGMKRRLMVAIAFCAGSRVVVLDEPTSGVDPVARRQIWDLVVRLKQGRTILLTTHHLDEADILSDRIVIIHQGKLQCCGSPLYLKTQFGSGYQLSLALKSIDGRGSGNVDDAQLNANKINTFSSNGSCDLLDLLASSPGNQDNSSSCYDNSTVASSAVATLEFWQKTAKLADDPLMMEVALPDQTFFNQIMLSNGTNQTTQANCGSKENKYSLYETSFLGRANSLNKPCVTVKTSTAAEPTRSSLLDRLQVIDRLIIANVQQTQRVDTSAHHVTYLLPFGSGATDDNERSKSASNMVKLLHELHLQREQLGLVSFGLTSTSMEDVFLNITTCVDRGIDVRLIPPMAACHLARNAFVARRDSNCSYSASSASSSRRPSFAEGEQVMPAMMNKSRRGNFQYQYSTLNRRASFDDCKGARRKNRVQNYFSRSLVHMRALLRKRLYHNLRNTKTLLGTLFLPILFIFVAMSLSFLRPSHNDYPALKLDSRLYGPGSRMFFATPNLEEIHSDVDGFKMSQAKKIAEQLKLSLTDCKTDPDYYRDSSDVEEAECLMDSQLVFHNDNQRSETMSRAFSCYCDDKFTYKCNVESNTTKFVNHSPDIYYVLNNKTKDALYDLTGHSVESWLLQTTNDNDYAESRFGGWTLGHSAPGAPHDVVTAADRAVYTASGASKVWFNNRGFHAMTAYLNGLNNALLRYAMSSSSYEITTYSHPLNLTATQLSRYTILQNVSDVGVALVILTGFSFIPAAAIVYLVGERVSEEKQLQLISGVRPWLYWLVAFIWDYIIVYLISVPLVAAVLFALQIDMYYSGYNFAAILSLIGLFGFACLPMLYIVSRLFDDASFAYTVLFCGNVFVGMLSVTTTTTLSFFYFVPDLARLHWLCETIFLIFLPQFCLGSGLVETVKAHIRSRIAQRLWCDGAKAAMSPALLPACRTHFTLNPFRLDVMGNRLVAMAIQGVVFFAINLILEYASWSWLLAIVRSVRARKLPFIARNSIIEQSEAAGIADEQDDFDVVQERLRVLCGKARGDVLQISSLSKIYNSGAGSEHLAVDRLSFGVRRGECFGLLGFNGAGKTTTFRMLAGQLSPTSGTAIVNHSYKLKKSSVYTLNGLLGYCPQADALDMLLTVHETLMIYAELRGLTPHSERLKQVQKLMRTLQLLPYTDVRNGNLSGGNRRKVSVAIAMLGNPKLILMDEPTSGMDPGTRRLVWEVVSAATQQGRSVILTSHSMEECDALCSRLGIMLNGRLKCIGTPVHLKNKFGRGYVCTIRMSAAHFHPEKLLAFMLTHFGSRCSLRQQHHQAFDFNIAAGDADLAHVFQVLEQARVALCLEDYAISQCTLDQVFVEIASQQAEDLRDRVVESAQFANINDNADAEESAVGCTSADHQEILLDLSGSLHCEQKAYDQDFNCTDDDESRVYQRAEIDFEADANFKSTNGLQKFRPPPYLRLDTSTPVMASTAETRRNTKSSPDIDLLKDFGHV